MTTAPRNSLPLAALAAASSMIALAAPAQAQSVCSAAGLVVTCTNGGATTTLDADSTLVATAQGLQITDPSTLALATSGTINTNAALPALQVTSTGNQTVTAGSGGALNIAATGTGPGATLTSLGTLNATLGTISSVGSWGVLGSGATGATVTTGAVTDSNVAVSPLTLSLIPGGTAGVAAAAASTTGPAAIVVNGAVNASGAVDPIIGVLGYAPGGTASATVNGPITVTNTAGGAVGGAAIGDSGATVTATGPVVVTGTAGANLDSAGLVAVVSGTGTATVNSGSSVTVTGPDASGIVARGTDAVIASPNTTVLVTGNDSTGVFAQATNSINARVGNVTANVSTAGAATTAIELEAPGAITLVAGNLATNGAGAPAVVVTGATGNVGLTTGTIATSGAGSAGLVANTTTGNLAVTTNTVTTTGANSPGIQANTTTGTLALNTGRVTSTGAGVSTTSTTGAQALTVAGVQSTGTGINAVATGTAPITITATAPVNSTAGFGIDATGTTGTIVVNEAGASGALGGVRVNGTGTVGVNATGGTTTSTGGDAVQLTTAGTATTTIAAGATVRGQAGFDGVDTRGTTANVVNVNGTLGADAPGLAVNATGGATTVNVGAGGSLTGAASLTGNADTINNSGTFIPTGTVAFGAGADVLNNNAGGTLALTQGATITGLETLGNSGTVNLAGTATLTGTTFANNAGGRVVAVAGPATLTGQTTFNNAGLITMVDGAADDSLTINSNYNGTGAARLAVDVNGSAAAADRLVINGNATGSTVIDPNFVGGATYNPTGVVLVTTSGTVATGAFTLNPAAVSQGFLNAGLVQAGGTTRLVNTLDSSVTDFGLAGSLAQEVWYQSFDAYNDAVRSRHAGSLDTGNKIGIWGQLYESKDRYGDAGRSVVTTAGNTLAYSDQLRTHRRGAQVGLEYRGPGFVVGATGGYDWARTEDQPVAASLRATGHNWGVYGLFGMANGLYAGLLYKRDDLDVSFFNGARGIYTTLNDVHVDGVDGEVGFKSTAGSFGFDVQAGLSYVKTNMGTASQQGLDFGWTDNKSLRGRIGGRIIFPQAMGAFIGAKLFHEFRDDALFRVTSAGASVADIAMPHRGTWTRIEGGLAAHGALFTLWGDVGDTKSFGGRIGFRF